MTRAQHITSQTGAHRFILYCSGCGDVLCVSPQPIYVNAPTYCWLCSCTYEEACEFLNLPHASKELDSAMTARINSPKRRDERNKFRKAIIKLTAICRLCN